VHGRAVNPITNAAWFDLLGKTLQGEIDEDNELDEKVPILEENTHGVDESGFWGAGGVRERVMGAAGKNVQHQQEDGSCENTTVIVTICANGTSFPPAVIFKGQAYQVKWDQNNPTKASCVTDISYLNDTNHKQAWLLEEGLDGWRDWHRVDQAVQSTNKTEGKRTVALTC
jgi:hypothetical protein